MNQTLATALCAALLLACGAVRSADDVPLSPSPGVLLLNNGQLIAGAITASGDRYGIRLKDGEIRIKRSDVAVVGRDAQECYRFKRSGIGQGRVQAHMELAEWCLNNDLVGSAEE